MDFPLVHVHTCGTFAEEFSIERDRARFNSEKRETKEK